MLCVPPKTAGVTCGYYSRRVSTPNDSNQLRGTLPYKGAFGFEAHVRDLQRRVPRRRPCGRKSTQDFFAGPMCGLDIRIADSHMYFYGTYLFQAKQGAVPGLTGPQLHAGISLTATISGH